MAAYAFDMRPQDIVVLLKILLIQEKDWQYRDLSSALFLSISEISESPNRSHIAGLVGGDKKVSRQSMMEFIRYGIHLVFPEVPGTMFTGIATAHSYSFYSRLFKSGMKYA